MKQLLIIGLSLMALAACKSNRAPNPKDPTSIEKSLTDTAYFTNITWIDSVVNFGTINMGEKVEVKFRFRNTGEFPLILSGVTPGCGCTVTDYTSAPIAPKDEGFIVATFDSNRSHGGNIRKSVYANSNTKLRQKHELVFTGEVRDCEVAYY